MNNEPRDEDLPHDAQLSQLYAALEKPEPSPALDDAILAAARRAANTRPQAVPGGGTRLRRWSVPLAAAASLVLVVMLVRQERPQDGALPEGLHEAQQLPAPAPAPQAAAQEPQAPAPQVAVRQTQVAPEPAPSAETPVADVAAVAGNEAPLPAAMPDGDGAAPAPVRADIVREEVAAPPPVLAMRGAKDEVSAQASREGYAAPVTERRKALAKAELGTAERDGGWPEAAAEGQVVARGYLAGMTVLAVAKEGAVLRLVQEGMSGDALRTRLERRLAADGWVVADECADGVARWRNGPQQVELRPQDEELKVVRGAPGC